MDHAIDSLPSGISHVVGFDAIHGDSAEDTEMLREMGVEAENFLLSFPWCSEITDRYFGGGVGKLVAVFLFRIGSSRVEVDSWLWVVVGDLPPAYLVTDSLKTPLSALRAYVELRRDWVNAVREGASTSGLMPMIVPATAEWASKIESRLDFIDRDIVPFFELLQSPKQ
jgi:hypothetical protein